MNKYNQYSYFQLQSAKCIKFSTGSTLPIKITKNYRYEFLNTVTYLVEDETMKPLERTNYH